MSHIKKYIPYPNYNEKDFFDKIYKKQEFYENKSKVDKFEVCNKEANEKHFKLLNHQILVRNYLSGNTPYNSILLFHGMGTGKTCSAITIAEAYRKLITGITEMKKILVLRLGVLIEENFKKELHTINKGYEQCTFSEYLNYNEWDSMPVKQRKLDALVNKNYEFEGYQSLVNKLKKAMEKVKTKKDFYKWIEENYSNRIILVDEVHNLKAKKNTKKENKSRYNSLLLICRHAKNIKLVLLSGTPMYHKPDEIIDIINLMLANDKRQLIDKKKGYNTVKGKQYIFDKYDNLTHFGKYLIKNKSTGYISYITSENKETFPTRKWPSYSAYETKTINEYLVDSYNINLPDNLIFNNEYKLVICELQDLQLRTYKRYIKDSFDIATSKKDIHFNRLINLQLLNHDPYGLHTENIIELKPNLPYLKSNAIKLHHLMLNLLNNSTGKTFIFSMYKAKGVFSISKLLAKFGIGFYKISGMTTNFDNLQSITNEGKKICSICKKIKDHHNEDTNHTFNHMRFSILAPNLSKNYRTKVLEIFNDSRTNLNGERISIILGTLIVKEGVSFLGVRNLHIMDPWYNKSRIEQIIGRGRRHCSHRHFENKKDRNITIFLYCAVSENGLLKNPSGLKSNQLEKMFFDTISSDNQLQYFTLDILMWKGSEINNNKIASVEKILKENAIDCMINKQRNIDSLPDNLKYKCNIKTHEHLDEKEIDTSTYTDIFLTPYIKHATNIIRKKFMTNRLIKASNYDLRRSFSEFKPEKITELLNKAFFELIPQQNQRINNSHIINHWDNTLEKIITGYIVSLNYEKDHVYIFKPFINREVPEKNNDPIKPIYDSYFIDLRKKNRKITGEQLQNNLKSISLQNKNKNTTIAYSVTHTVANKPRINNKLWKKLDPINRNDNEIKVICIKWKGRDFFYIKRKNPKKEGYAYRDIASFTSLELKDFLENGIIGKLNNEHISNKIDTLLDKKNKLFSMKKLNNKQVIELIIDFNMELHNIKYKKKKWYSEIEYNN